MREEKIFFVFDCFSLSRYIKGGKKSNLETQMNFQTHMLYKQHPLTKWWNYILVQILYSSLGHTGRLFFGCALFEKPRGNEDRVTEKSTQNNLCEGHYFFNCTPPAPPLSPFSTVLPMEELLEVVAMVVCFFCLLEVSQQLLHNIITFFTLNLINIVGTRED